MTKIYKMSNGMPVDMEALRIKHANTVAAGNMKVNARGDKLGKNGQVVEPVEERAREHHATVRTETKSVSLKTPIPEPVEPVKTESVEPVKPEPVAEPKKTKARSSAKPKKNKNEIELPDGSIQIRDEFE